MDKNTNKEYPRLVSWSYYPASRYYKSGKELLIEVYLNDPAGETILEEGLLPQLGFMMWKDPYFTVKKTHGRTYKARTHGNIVKKFEKNYPELKDKLAETKRVLLDFGEYIFIDLPHINNYVNPIVTGEKQYNEQYIRKEFFNEELIREFIKYKPRDLIGRSEITDYQEENLPAFLNALSLFDEELYDNSIKNTDFEDKQADYVGLQAKLPTLIPGKVLYTYYISGEEFDWDGETLTKTKEVKDGSSLTISVKPSSNAVVEILENKTVTSETKFV